MPELSETDRWTTVRYKLHAVPICLGCHRRTFGMNVELPAPPLYRRMETCSVCQHPTNHGLYLEER